MGGPQHMVAVGKQMYRMLGGVGGKSRVATLVRK